MPATYPTSLNDSPEGEDKRAQLIRAFHRHEQDLRIKARVLLHSQRLAPDEHEVWQELWKRVLIHAEQYDDQRDVLGWLYGIIRNIVREQARRNRRRQTWITRFSKLSPREPDTAALVVDTLYHDDPRAWQEAKLALKQLLALLREDRRELLAAYHLEDVSIDELARRYGTTNGNIRVRLSRALARLRAVAAERD